jgi:predicted RND superfamily exporter protein/outer membrane lipoprotein-sorting protein
MATNKSTENLRISKLEIWAAVGLLLFIVTAAGLSVKSLTKLRTQYSLSQFLPADHPLLKADRATRAKFFLDQTQPILITLELDEAKHSDWLRTERLERLARATVALSKLDGTQNAMSLGTVQAASQSSDQLSVGTLLNLTSEQSRRARVSEDKFLTPMLVSENARRTLIVLGVKENQTTEALNNITNQARLELEKVFPEARVSIGGVPAIQTQLTSLVKKELVRFMGLALLACCLTLLIVFSSPWSVLVPFLAILITNIFVLAFMSAVGFSMTVLAVTIPILVSVTVLSLCVHTMLRYVEDAHNVKRIGRNQERFSPKAALVFSTLRSLFVPNLLTSLTTCFGFSTLIITQVPVIREFGIAVSVSVMISWIVSTLILAPLLALLPVPVMRSWVMREARWTAWIFKGGRGIVALVVVGCIGLAIAGRNLHWSARLFDDLPKNEEARRTTEDIDSGLGGTIPFEVLVENQSAAEPWNDPQAINSIDHLLASVRAIPEVGSAVGLPDLLRLAAGSPAGLLPESRSAIAESWFLMSMSENSPLKNFLTADGSTMRLSLRMRDVAGDQMDGVLEKIQAQVQGVFPQAKVTTGGMATTIHHLNDELSRSLLEGYWQALAVIAFLLALVFRSWRWTLTAILPNLVPAAILIGVLALAKTPIKPGVALVFSIALGIAFNNTVYLLQRLKSLMEESGGGPGENIERALRLEGNPCMVASLCLLAGFGIFIFSEFGINQTFGAYMLVSLFFGLVGDLAFLPALIKLAPWILVSTPRASHDNLEGSVSIAQPAFVAQIPTLLEVQASPEGPMAAKSREESLVPRVAASVAALLVLFSHTPPAQAAMDANGILKNVERGLNSKDERALLKMKVVESNGSSKEREVEIKRKSGGKHQVLVRLKSPSDVSGVALLSVSQGGSEDQWLYMPSQKKARRVVSGNKSQKFLDTEFSLEDFSAGTYARFENKVIKEERAPSSATPTIAVIESKSKTPESSYSRILTWVDLASYQVQKSEYYDKEGKLLKTMVFRDYKKYGTAWRAQTIEVRNMQTQRSTVLKVAGMKLNSGLTDREFTQGALENED